MASCGAKETPNTVPLPELPPPAAVSYRMLSDKTNPAIRIGSVVVGKDAQRISASRRETMQVRRTRTVSVELEHRKCHPLVPTAGVRRPKALITNN